MLKKCTKKLQKQQNAKEMHKEAAEVAECWRNASRTSRIVSSAFLHFLQTKLKVA